MRHRPAPSANPSSLLTCNTSSSRPATSVWPSSADSSLNRSNRRSSIAKFLYQGAFWLHSSAGLANAGAAPSNLEAAQLQGSSGLTSGSLKAGHGIGMPFVCSTLRVCVAQGGVVQRENAIILKLQSAVNGRFLKTFCSHTKTSILCKEAN